MSATLRHCIILSCRHNLSGLFRRQQLLSGSNEVVASLSFRSNDKEPYPDMPDLSLQSEFSRAVEDQPTRTIQSTELTDHQGSSWNDAHRRRFFEAIFLATADQIITSPAACREQMFSAFLNNLSWLQDEPSRYMILPKLRTWFQPRCTSDVLATDCLLLLSFARTTKNHELFRRARQRHQVAVYSLKHKLGQPMLQADNLLVSMDALGICHLFERQPKHKHAQGLSSILKALGPRYARTAAGFSRDLIFNAMHINLIASLQARQPCIFGTPQWSRALESTCRGRMWCLFHFTCKIPAALKKIDDMAPAALTQSTHLFRTLIALRTQFQDWLLTWYDEIIGPPYRLVDTSHFREFSKRYHREANVFPRV